MFADGPAGVKKYHEMKSRGALDSEIYVQGLADGLRDLAHMNMVTEVCGVTITGYKALGLQVSERRRTIEEHQGDLAEGLAEYFEAVDETE